jgi:hypothetical protein
MWLVMLNHYNLGLYVGWFEIPHDFIGLPQLYGLKCQNLITSVIVFILLLLYFGRFHDTACRRCDHARAGEV